MTWLIGAVFFVVCAAGLFWKREELAEMQSLIAGGSVVPGCVVAEAIVVLAMALLLVGAWWFKL